MEKELKEMSFLDHLEDLRWLLIRITIAVIVIACLSYFIIDFIFEDVIFAPIRTDFITYKLFCELTTYLHTDDGGMCVTEMPFIIQSTDMGGQFSVFIWTCITCGFILGFPYILWEIWKFISPALYKNEKKNAILFITTSSILFFIGVLFGYFLILPLSVQFFGAFNVSKVIQNEFNLDNYMGMVKTSVISCGLIFELPIIIYFLTKLGLVTAVSLREYRRYAIVIILIVAAIITPPDILSQIIVSIPLLVLYEASILIAIMVNKKQQNV
ncbi:twin-arginine translocase subunit TatC [Flavobacterium branchiophilum]|uniref:Sec-independent protein translocase protein TatC n=1 Tax=Flavobacterium branchiophilum TaxID=55197 RepID=A0A2H3KJB8_9FLAO|nr:twin-arginine translocase subunit TatC [Flavobacterium branchiophilum]PDS24904.1 twin-arginine translocase subunit TatC [Flavobacterium branchiophilum]